MIGSCFDIGIIAMSGRIKNLYDDDNDGDENTNDNDKNETQEMKQKNLYN